MRVYGSGFDPTASNNTVEFIDSTGTATAGTVLGTQGAALTTEVPSGLVGPVRIAVERSDGRRDTTTARFTPIETGIGDRSFAPVSTSIPNLNDASLDWGDYDGDGDLDLLVRGTEAENPRTAIYRNDGNGTFTDIGATLSADFGQGAVEWGDYDADGDLDFIVLTGQETLVYRNDGNGTFTDIAAGLTDVAIGSVDWVDYDRDGALDLLVTGRDGSAKGIMAAVKAQRVNQAGTAGESYATGVLASWKLAGGSIAFGGVRLYHGYWSDQGRL